MSCAGAVSRRVVRGAMIQARRSWIGFDVGAHVHDVGEEIFYIVEGELDLFVFEPIDRTVPDWHDWESPSGERPRRVDPGAFMFVPPGTPHAFSNLTDRPAKVLFQSSVPGGHENYFDELMAILEAGRGTPDLTRLAALRTRYHIEELTTIHQPSPAPGRNRRSGCKTNGP
jgi:mannose-6-phosphate isomerase-like protein (cupin superfamily)